jgi:hypothetical protein
MKEILLVLQVIFTSFVAPPYNMLDLSNLYIHPESQMAYTIEAIEVEKDQIYTIVIDESSLGQHLDHISDFEIEIESQFYDFYVFQYDVESKRAYVSFSAKSEWMYIHQIPASFYGSFNIMMYQGTYEDFIGFEHFHTPTLSQYTIPLQSLDALALNNVPFISSDVILLEETDSFPKYKLYKHKDAPFYYLINFQIYDRTPPSIYGPTEILVYQSQEPLSDEYIINQFNITDQNDFIVSISFNQYNQTRTPGRYQVKIHAVDTSNNETTHNTFINVIDDTVSEIELRPYVIETSIFQTLTLEEIYEILDAYLNQLNMPYEGLEVVLNTYALSKSTPGNYEIYYDVIINDQTYDGLIQVKVNHPIEEKAVQYGLIGLAGILGSIVFLGARKQLKKKR